MNIAKHLLYAMTSHSLFPTSSEIQSRLGRIGQVQIVILLGSIDSITNQSYSDVRNKRLTRCQWQHSLVLISTNRSSLQLMRMGKILHFLQTYCRRASIFHILQQKLHTHAKFLLFRIAIRSVNLWKVSKQ